MTNNFIKEIQEKGVRLSIGLQANIPINATFDKDMLVISKEVFDSLITHTALRTIEEVRKRIENDKVFAVHKYKCDVMNKSGMQICSRHCKEDFICDHINELEAEIKKNI